MEETFFCVFPQSRCHKSEEEMNRVQIMVVAVRVRKGEQTAGIKESYIKEKGSGDIPLNFILFFFQLLKF